MYKKRAFTKVMAALLCVFLVMPMAAFAQGNNAEAESVTEPTGAKTTETTEATEATEATEPDSPVEDKVPIVGKARITVATDESYDDPNFNFIPITYGTGKYEASKVVLTTEYEGIDLRAYTAIEKVGVDVTATFPEGASSGKAGSKPITVQFLNRKGEVVYEDKDSVEFYMEEDWNKGYVPDGPVAIETNSGPAGAHAWDGSSDLVIPMELGSGLGKIQLVWNTQPFMLYGSSVYNEELYRMKEGDISFDFDQGTITIKSDYFKRLVREDPTFGDEPYYFISFFLKWKGNFVDNSYNEVFITYDKNAASTEVPVKEITLEKDHTAIAAADMAALVEENKTSDIVIHNANGVDFTFAKGTMNLIDGVEAYDFGTTIITDAQSSNVSGIPADEFVFRVNFNYSGKLPGTAKISFSLGKDSKWIGKTLCYSQVESGKATAPIYENTVDKDGIYTVEQNHCSDYVAVVKTAKPGSNTPKPDSDTPKPDSVTPKPDSVTPKPDSVTPQTGDGSNVVLMLGLMAVSAAGLLAVAACNRKKYCV